MLAERSSGSVANGNTGMYGVTFSNFLHPHYDPSLPDLVGTCGVVRYERTATVTFPVTFTSPPAVWVRPSGTKGWPYFGSGSAISYYVNDNYAEVVPGSLTTTGCTLRTYVYNVYDTMGNNIGWYPTAPGNVTFAYSVFGRTGSPKVAVSEDTTSSTESALGNIPPTFSLSPNSPNPFNPVTQIRFGLPRGERVQVDIYNIQGQRVRRLVDAGYPAGYHEMQWDSKDDAGRVVSSGVYFCHLTAGGFTQTRKMLLLK